MTKKPQYAIVLTCDSVIIMITNPTIPHTTGMQIESRFISLLALSTKINCRRHSKKPIIPPYKKNSKFIFNDVEPVGKRKYGGGYKYGYYGEYGY